MKIIVVADTFLKFLPDPIGQLRASRLPNQVILLKEGTELEIYNYSRLQGIENSRPSGHKLPDHKLPDYTFIRLATPLELTGHQNLCWFVETAHIEIEDSPRRGDFTQESLRHCTSTQSKRNSYRQHNPQRKLELANPMDSFCGLAVSPPVTVRGQYYPFGRIAYNSYTATGHGPASNQIGQSPQTASELSDFFKAQKIQSPFGLHTNWLIVDRVDEIISFLPANNEKGFQVLVASPLSANIILQGLADSGFADTAMFQGVKRANYNNLPGIYQKAEISIGDLLQDAAFWEANTRYQSYMNDNIQTLRAELDISEHHLLNIPVLFHPPLKSGRTASYFPNMVNHRLLEDGSLLAPQPKGPIINGKCAFETALEYAIPSRRVRFAKAWYAQHKWQGEVSLWA